MKIPKFKNKKKEIAFVVKHKKQIMTQKKSVMKKASGVAFSPVIIKSRDAKKSAANKNKLQVKAIINTTNLFDSHGDVHLPKIWNKSIKENKNIMHVQEHKSDEFDKIISSGRDLQVSVKTYSWKELGLDEKGFTQALEFNSNIRKSRNSFMFNEYKNGHVTNHSVGMNYVKMFLAVNDKDHAEEYKNWQDNIDKVVNKKDAERVGMIWFIQEAKVTEGSAVPAGSNFMTPTMSVKNKKKLKKQKELKAIKSFLKI